MALNLYLIARIATALEKIAGIKTGKAEQPE
jgi:hypothetical protein